MIKHGIKQVNVLNSMLNVNGSLSPAQFMAVKFIRYSTLCIRITLQGLEGIRFIADSYGGVGEMEIV